MKLSILICSVKKRLSQLHQLVTGLEGQARDKSVEILWLGDTKTMSVGTKRNKLILISSGEYICFIDDDDRISDNYVDEILKATEKQPDVITFKGLYDNKITKEQFPVIWGIHQLNVNEKTHRVRMPNHLTPIKREIVLKVMFQEKNFGEDTAYGMALRNKHLLKTEAHIDDCLYFYDYNESTSETAIYSPLNTKVKGEPMVKMDVVIVSDGTELKQMTQNAIDSIAGEETNVIVLEKADVHYSKADTFKQKEPFNYNQCLNEGAMYGNAELICFSNNDVVFPEGFVQKAYDMIGNCEVLSVRNQHNFIHPSIVSGFCFIMRRDAWLKIGKHNENYKFWCADNATTEQIRKAGMREIKSNIKVTHICSVTLKKLPEQTHEDYTRGCVKKFNKDYGQNVLNMGI